MNTKAERGSSSSNEGEIQMYLLNAEQIVHYWDEMWGEMVETLPGLAEKFNEDWVQDMALRGAYKFWTVGEGKIELVLITRTVAYPEGYALQVVGAFGSRIDEFLPRIDATLERVARMQGASWIEVTGRKGWERVLKPFGFELSQVVLTRAVKGRVQ